MRCPLCGGYLINEPEWLGNPARVRCIMGDWAVTDPNFRKNSRHIFLLIWWTNGSAGSRSTLGMIYMTQEARLLSLKSAGVFSETV